MMAFITHRLWNFAAWTSLPEPHLRFGSWISRGETEHRAEQKERYVELEQLRRGGDVNYKGIKIFPLYHYTQTTIRTKYLVFFWQLDTIMLLSLVIQYGTLLSSNSHHIRTTSELQQNTGLSTKSLKLSGLFWETFLALL